MSDLRVDSASDGHKWLEHHYDAGKLGHLTGLKAVDAAGLPLVYYFGGIPYAQAPTGERRFRAPRQLPKDHRYGTREAPGRFVTGTRPCPQPASSNTPAASAMSEDCLQLNMWVPAGTVPAGGWPVCVWIHGGFLQVGSPNLGRDALVPLLADPASAVRAIVVMPGYRLNALGFLAGSALAAETAAAGEPCGNAGLWDQRAALEWTRDCIAAFGGDAANISVLGYSAGAYSVFQQLAHELYRREATPAEPGIIRRVAMLSNGPGVRPKTLDDQQRQFDELARLLGVPADLSPAAQLAALRQRPWQDLIGAQGAPSMVTMHESEFRPWADGSFCPGEVFAAIDSGDFAARMRARGITLLTGECEQEHTVYVRWRTPDDSHAAVERRLRADYGEVAGRRVLEFYCGRSSGSKSNGALPAGYADWQNLFGRLYANVQVHHLSRGFLNGLIKGGLVPGRDVLRYRMERRLACVDERLLPEWGATHLSDIPVWLWGADYAGGLTGDEKAMLAGWNQSLAEFVRGDAVVSGWEGISGPRDVRRWRKDGGTDTWQDGELWDQGVAFWKFLSGTG